MLTLLQALMDLGSVRDQELDMVARAQQQQLLRPAGTAGHLATMADAQFDKPLSLEPSCDLTTAPLPGTMSFSVPPLSPSVVGIH
jgi:hypothetical protein